MSSRYAFYPVAPLAADCDRIARAVKRDRLDIVVLLDRTRAFGCAVAPTPVRTINFPYEARTWTLQDAARRPVRRLVLIPAPPHICDIARRRKVRCAKRDGGAVITVPPRPVLNTLAVLGLRARPFGPGCVIDANRCASGTDARHAFPRPIANQRLADAAHAGATAALTSIQRGKPSAVEVGVDRTRVVPRLARALHTRGVVLRVTQVQPTGTNTARARVVVRGSARSTVDVQFIELHGRWLLAARSLCTLAATQHVSCKDPLPFFPD